MTQAFLDQMGCLRNFDGLKTPNPSSFGDWGVIGKKVEAKNPNGVSAKCEIVKKLMKTAKQVLGMIQNAVTF
jgi:hypothetical protein